MSNPAGFSTALGNFLGSAPVAVPKLNRSADRPFADVILRFRHELEGRAIPAAMLRTYETPSVRWFWSEDEINRMINSWSSG